MGKKYIVELEEHERIYKAKLNTFNDPVVQGIAGVPYTEPNLEQVRKEAYDKGFDDGRNKCPSVDVCQNQSYQKGLADAWEAARKIVLDDINIILSVFGTGSRSIIIRDLTAVEVIEKLKTYKQKQEQDAEIKIGDELQFKDTGNKFIVTRVFTCEDDRKCEGFFDDGEVYEISLEDNVEKTGRYFPEIVAVFKKMNEPGPTA